MGEGREAQHGGIYIIRTDLCCGTAETNTTLCNNFPTINKKGKRFSCPITFLRTKKVGVRNQWNSFPKLQ